MKVFDVMSKTVVTVTPKTSFRDLWKLIFQKHVHALPVVDSKKKLLGIVAEEDLLKPLYPDYRQYIEDFVSASDFEQMEEKLSELKGITSDKIMNRRVIFTRVDTPIMRALSRMIVRNVHQLPVVSDDEVVIGVVSKGDIFDSLFRRQVTKKLKAVKK